MKRLLKELFVIGIGILFLSGIGYAEQPNWTVIGGTQYNMALYGDIFLEGTKIDNQNYLLAAFGPGGDTDCRAKITTGQNPGLSYYFTPVGNVDGQTLSFKIYDTIGDKIYDIKETISFQTDETIELILAVCTPEKCDGEDNDCDDLIDEEGATGCAIYYKDADADGYGLDNDTKCLCAPEGQYIAPVGGDCDDTEAAINPDATEACDQVDNDCDDLIDEEGATGCVAYYKDADADGYGLDNDSKCLCGPDGEYTTTVAGDCDDTEAAINPGATEACDEVDNDCDELIDEEGATGCVVYYKDTDADGYGLDNDNKCLCATEGEYTATQGGDCDDTEAAINPGATEACDLVDNDCDELIDEEDATGCTTYYKDADGDGYGLDNDSKCLCAAEGEYTAAVGGDCDDTEAAINPDAIEACDQVDNDCDDLIDEEGADGCVAYYKDVDADGYGVNNDTKCLCGPDGEYTTTVAGDCDDTEAAINPGATEACDQVDNDCDELIDEEGATGCITYYKDVDGDGYGLDNDAKCLCTSEGEYTATVAGDCDDTEAAINPDATEACDQIDNDCDELIDEEGATGCTTYYKDADEDGYGLDNDSKCLCGPTGEYTATVVGDCDDTEADINPDAIEACDQVDNDCDDLIDEEGADGCVAYYKDADADGYGLDNDSKCLCGPEGEYTATVAGDCDDTEPAINPGAIEACDEVDNDCDELIDEEGATGCVVYYKDADEDGYGLDNDSKCLCATEDEYTATVGGDCDDTEAAINPGATEACDEVDNDCDDLIDEEGATGCTTYYKDVDEDGYGVDNDTKCLCAPKSIYSATKGGDSDDTNPEITTCTIYYKDADGDGYGLDNDSQCILAPEGEYTATFGGDCDDTEAAINPGATEACDQVDNDCDELIDEEGATGCITYYKDADADGYGLDNDNKCLCAAEGEYTATIGGDCDDTEAVINPGATEACDQVDNDCDDLIDEEGATGCVNYYKDADGDGYGVDNDTKCLCGPEGEYTTTTAGDCDDTNDQIIKPIADFNYSPTIGDAPLEVQFTEKCIDAFTSNPTVSASYSWDFGDGQTSDEKDDHHVYQAPGTYTATLTLQNGECLSEKSKSIRVLVTSTLTGIVFDEDTGQEIAGAGIRVMGHPKHRYETNEGGRYTIEGLRFGTYWLRVFAQKCETRFIRLENNPGIEDIPHIYLKSKTGQIKGRVLHFLDASQPELGADLDNPVSDARVIAFTREAGLYSREAQTDPNGAYTLFLSEPGDYTLYAFKFGYIPEIDSNHSAGYTIIDTNTVVEVPDITLREKEKGPKVRIFSYEWDADPNDTTFVDNHTMIMVFRDSNYPLTNISIQKLYPDIGTLSEKTPAPIIIGDTTFIPDCLAEYSGYAGEEGVYKAKIAVMATDQNGTSTTSYIFTVDPNTTERAEQSAVSGGTSEDITPAEGGESAEVGLVDTDGDGECDEYDGSFVDIPPCGIAAKVAEGEDEDPDFAVKKLTIKIERLSSDDEAAITAEYEINLLDSDGNRVNDFIVVDEEHPITIYLHFDLAKFDGNFANIVIQYQGNDGEWKTDGISNIRIEGNTIIFDVIHLTLFKAVSIDVSPANLSASVAGTSQIDLQWEDRTSNEYYFEVWRSVNEDPNSISNYNQIAAVDPNSTSYSDPNCSINDTYYYRVRAFTAQDYTVYSNKAGATINESGEVPAQGDDGGNCFISSASRANDLWWRTIVRWASSAW